MTISAILALGATTLTNLNPNLSLPACDPGERQRWELGCGQSHLFDAGFVWVVERSCLHVLGNQPTANFGNLFPVLKHGQSKLLVCTSPSRPYTARYPTRGRTDQKKLDIRRKRRPLLLIYSSNSGLVAFVSAHNVHNKLVLQTRSIWKMLGPFATASRLTPIHQMSLAVLLRAACASMSTTTTTTTRDKGNRYGPMEWAQW